MGAGKGLRLSRVRTEKQGEGRKQGQTPPARWGEQARAGHGREPRTQPHNKGFFQKQMKTINSHGNKVSEGEKYWGCRMEGTLEAHNRARWREQDLQEGKDDRSVLQDEGFTLHTRWHLPISEHVAFLR